MNPFLNFLAVSSFTAALLTGASHFVSSSPDVVANPSAVEFTSHVRSKVVQYFDTLEDDPSGLPSGSGEPEMTPGRFLVESERESLTDVPMALARVLPDFQKQVNYHIAGRYLIAVDSRYKILDSILISAAHRTPPGDREMVQWATDHVGEGR